VYIFFLLASAYFASVETAYTAVSRVKLRTLAEKGNKRAKKALWVCDRYDKTLSTILVGNNLFHAACASFTTLFVTTQFGPAAVTSGTFVTTLIVYLVAEMIPKSFAKVRNEELALFFATSMVILVKVLTPVSAIFSGISALMSRFMESSETKTVTEEELISIIETIEDEGVLEPEKQALVSSAMEFREKLAKNIMVPMEEVVSVSSSVSTEELVKLLKESNYSRLPVYEGKKENVVGILPVNIFLSHYTAGKKILLRKILLKPYVFDQNTEISALLQRMRLNKLHMVFLIDEKKNKVGMITMEDLLEELVGEIQDESDAGEGVELAMEVAQK
jgi:CBS domain containing-hemolysin-like protein